jgi:hypothetical protein
MMQRIISRLRRLCTAAEGHKGRWHNNEYHGFRADSRRNVFLSLEAEAYISLGQEQPYTT